MAQIKVGVLLMRLKMTPMFYARSSVSNGFTLVEASHCNFAHFVAAIRMHSKILILKRSI
jgi:hypothetical protein